MMFSWHEIQCENMAETGKFPVPDFRRASGGTICEGCAYFYRDHPSNIPHHWLTMLCDGTYVKL